MCPFSGPPLGCGEALTKVRGAEGAWQPVGLPGGGGEADQEKSWNRGRGERRVDEGGHAERDLGQRQAIVLRTQHSSTPSASTTVLLAPPSFCPWAPLFSLLLPLPPPALPLSLFCLLPISQGSSYSPCVSGSVSPLVSVCLSVCPTVGLRQLKTPPVSHLMCGCEIPFEYCRSELMVAKGTGQEKWGD